MRLNELKNMHQELSMHAINFSSWVDTLPNSEYILQACAAVLRSNMSGHFEWSDPISNILEPYKERDHSLFGEPTT